MNYVNYMCICVHMSLGVHVDIYALDVCVDV